MTGLESIEDNSKNRVKTDETSGKADELSQEELDMLLNPHMNDETYQISGESSTEDIDLLLDNVGIEGSASKSSKITQDDIDLLLGDVGIVLSDTKSGGLSQEDIDLLLTPTDSNDSQDSLTETKTEDLSQEEMNLKLNPADIDDIFKLLEIDSNELDEFRMKYKEPGWEADESASGGSVLDAEKSAGLAASDLSEAGKGSSEMGKGSSETENDSSEAEKGSSEAENDSSEAKADKSDATQSEKAESINVQTISDKAKSEQPVSDLSTSTQSGNIESPSDESVDSADENISADESAKSVKRKNAKSKSKTKAKDKNKDKDKEKDVEKAKEKDKDEVKTKTKTKTKIKTKAKTSDDIADDASKQERVFLKKIYPVIMSKGRLAALIAVILFSCAAGVGAVMLLSATGRIGNAQADSIAEGRVINYMPSALNYRFGEAIDNPNRTPKYAALQNSVSIDGVANNVDNINGTKPKDGANDLKGADVGADAAESIGETGADVGAGNGVENGAGNAVGNATGNGADTAAAAANTGAEAVAANLGADAAVTNPGKDSAAANPGADADASGSNAIAASGADAFTAAAAPDADAFTAAAAPDADVGDLIYSDNPVVVAPLSVSFAGNSLVTGVINVMNYTSSKIHSAYVEITVACCDEKNEEHIEIINAHLLDIGLPPEESGVFSFAALLPNGNSDFQLKSIDIPKFVTVIDNVPRTVAITEI